MNKFKFFLSALSLSILSASAQNVIAPINIATQLASYQSNFQNTGVAIAENYDQMVSSVWEVNGSTTFDCQSLGAFPWNQQFIISGAQDPDIEYSGYGADLLFIGYHDGPRVIVESYNLTIPGGYVLNTSQTITVGNSTVQSVNIDIADGQKGVVVWQDGTGIFATTFNTNSHGIPTLLTQGEQPDIVGHGWNNANQVNHYTMTHISAGNNLQTVRGNMQDLTNGILNITTSYPQPNISPTGMGFSNPRIAKAKGSVNNSFNLDDFTVTAVRRDIINSSIENMIVGLSVTNGNFSYYDVTPNAGESVNTYPVVAYNDDRVKFAWASDYEAPLACGWGSSSLKRDVLSKEFDPVNMTFYYPNTLFEINNLQGLGFENCKPSISGTSTVVGDKTAYLYNTWGQTTNTIYVKLLDNMANPKRIAKPVNNEMILSKLNDRYMLSGENLTSYNYQLTNIQGQNMDLSSRMELSDSELSLDPNGLSKGMYFLNCQSKEHTTTVKILVD